MELEQNLKDVRHKADALKVERDQLAENNATLQRKCRGLEKTKDRLQDINNTLGSQLKDEKKGRTKEANGHTKTIATLEERLRLKEEAVDDILKREEGRIADFNML